jgi:hypothetical protein
MMSTAIYQPESALCSRAVVVVIQKAPGTDSTGAGGFPGDRGHFLLHRILIVTTSFFCTANPHI